jgi:hypothetical protein
MPAIPTYQRQVLPQGDLPVARANPNVPADDSIDRSMQGVGQAGMGLATSLIRDEAEQQRAAKKQQEDAAAVQVSNALSLGDVYWQGNFTNATQAWKVGDADLRDTLGKDFDSWVNENVAMLPTDASKKYFQQHAAGMKARLQTGVYSFQQKATTAKLDADTSVGMQADENTVFNDPTRFDDIFKRRMEPLIARSDLTEADKIKAAAKYKEQLHVAVERGQLERDPAGWYRERFGEFKKPGVAAAAPGAAASGSSFSSIMETIFKREGGYSASDGNTGAPVNFGINQKANPDIDVKSLTKEGAAKIYKTRYWDAIGADSLPPELQGTAMDAAVNQGPAQANRWIKESGGDPVKFNALRRAHYERLLEEPRNKKYRKAWLGRLADYENAAASTPVSTPAATPASSEVPTPPASFSSMDYEKQISLKNHAETLIKQTESIFKAQADRTLQDAVAMHKDGIVDPQELRPEFFQRAYGPDAERVRSEYLNSRDMASDIGKFKNQSDGEIAGTLQASQPVVGDGYAAEKQRHNTRMQAAHAVLQARNNDPAGFVASTNENLKRQRLALDNPQTPPEQRPALMQRYVGESLAEQQRLGIQNPRVLTPGQADVIASRAMKATRPEDSASLISGLESEYGAFFPKVFSELVKDGKIGGELLLIPNLPNQAAREAVSRLARVKESDLTQGLDAKAMKDAKDAVIAKMGEFVGAVAIPNEQAAGTVNAYETSLRKLAYQFMQGGQDGTTAANNAHKMLLGHYVFDGTMRVPKSIDLSLVKRGASMALDADLSGIDAPRDLVGARTPAEVATEWKSTVQSRPLWFSNDNDSGITLFAQGSDGVRYRVTRGGQPVSYTWDQLKTTVTKADEERKTFGSNARGKMREYNEQRRQDFLQFKQKNGIE